MSVETMPWSRLTPDQDRELEEILLTQPNDRFLSDYGDSTVPWIFGLIAGAAGAIASAMNMGWNVLGLWRLPIYAIQGQVPFQGLLYPAGFLVSVAVFLWAAWTWIGNHRRRGWAATSFATIRVKGRRLVLMRHAAVVRLEWTKIAQPGTQRFSVLLLTDAESATLTCYVHAGWVRTAIAQIDRGRAEAKLPPIEGDARKLPE